MRPTLSWLALAGALLVAAGRTAAQPPTPTPPPAQIPITGVSAMISGQVSNGTNGQIVSADDRGPLQARLRAFDGNLAVALTLTETVQSDGRFAFDLQNGSPDWFYRVAVFYNGLEFGSDFGVVSAATPILELPVTVYDQTSDPAAVTIDQLHIVLDFSEGQALVNELYVVSHRANTVYVGPAGDPTAGVFTVAVPAGAQSLEFQRGLAQLESFVPAEGIIHVAGDWADTRPLRPGEGSLSLLVRYALPYEASAILNHPLYYPAERLTAALPDNGVTLITLDGWSGGAQEGVNAGPILAFSHGRLPAGSDLTLTLSGRPRLSDNPTATLGRNQQAELLLGGLTLLLSVGLAAGFWRRWQSGPQPAPSQESLLTAIARLDEERAAGRRPEKEYRRARDRLKSELKAIWSGDRGPETEDRPD